MRTCRSDRNSTWFEEIHIMKVQCGVLTLLSLVCGAEASRCSPTSYYKNCWIRRFPGVFIDVEESQRRGAQLLQNYQEDSALKCSRTCCLTRNFSCNLAIFQYDTVQENANCYHLHCPTLESCILTHRGNVVLYNITKGVDPDLLVFGKYFTSNVRVLPHLYTRINASEPMASDKRQFNRPPRQPSKPVTPAMPVNPDSSRRTGTASTRTATTRTMGTSSSNTPWSSIQPTTSQTTLPSPTDLSPLGSRPTPDPAADSPQSQAHQSATGTPVAPLTATIRKTTTTTRHILLDQTSPQTDYKELIAESPRVSSSSTKQDTTRSMPYPSPPSTQRGTDTPAAVSDSSQATTMTSAATPSAAPLANAESGNQYAAGNETIGGPVGRNLTAVGNGEGGPWTNGAEGDGVGTEWRVAAHTLLVMGATCVTVLLSCCCTVLAVVSWRGRRKRKGRYRTTWRGKGESMRLIKYVLIREGS
ncbi:MANSC domain-containing protein 1-like [Gadus macrocephalus]|uniref:MANSC domain-containing protein 1-like n=1 Tax=Gadus macrocephalus TaxID=80720 RepID=UPI0028CBB831|nr:MANSC domain-containing protein 1-like [Gadus macrocephalus]